MGKLPIGDIGPCEVTWNFDGTIPVIITPHLGKVSLRMADVVTDVHIDGQGAAPIESFFEGATLELEVPMARSTLSQLANTIGYRELGTLTGNVLTLHNVAGREMLAHAKPIVIKLLCADVPDPNPNHWILIYLCHPYRDFELGWDRSGQRVHMVKFKVFINDEGEYYQEGVVCPPETPLLTKGYDDPAWYIEYKALCEFEDKLCAWDHGPGNADGRVIYTQDGVAWLTLFSRTAAQIGLTGDQCGKSMAVYNGSLFITKYRSMNAPRPRVIEWDGTNVSLHLNPPPEQDNYMASNLVVWDNKLWVLLDVTPGALGRRVVYYYDGANWTAILNYDGAAFLDYNVGAALPIYDIKQRTTRLFVFENELYLIATRYTGTKWAWEVWKYDTGIFTEIYNSDVFDDGCGLSAIIEFDDKVYLVGNEIIVANGKPGMDAKLYTSSDMTTWAVEATLADLGFPFGEELFRPASGECEVPSMDERFYLNCVNVDPGDLNTCIRYWNAAANEFTLQQTIDTLPLTAGGGIKRFRSNQIFGNTLYVGKYREIYASI